MGKRFIVVTNQESANEIAALGYVLINDADNTWVFLNDDPISLRFDISKQVGVCFSDTLHL